MTWKSGGASAIAGGFELETPVESQIIVMTNLFSAFALSLFLGIALNGCSEEQAPKQHGEQRSGLADVAQTRWLTEQDDVKPEVWLIEHEARNSGKSTGGDAREVGRRLAEASAKFHDSPRMVANRAVQLEGMLKEEGGDETAIVLITRLNEAIAPGHIESFGAAGQQYYNLRRAGFTGDQALDALSKRYGSRS